jgi:hypothetical protein
MVKHRILIFVVSVLYSLAEKWRGKRSSESFEEILSGQNGVDLNLAWSRLRKDNLLVEFENEFDLYASIFLKQILREAQVTYHLVRLGGNDLKYHLDAVSPNVIRVLLKRQKISIEFVQNVATRLNALLDEQERTAKSSTASR